MKRAGRAVAPAAEPAPLTHAAVLAAVLACALSIVLSVSFAIFDPDLFQHLLVGKVIWSTHAVPHRHLWTWPSYGQPEVLPSWLFRALLWPCWAIGGVPGLFVWRWLTALTAFGLGWAIARRLGARGVAPLVVIAWCALVYRQRSMVRPETLVVVLLALELWLLESRRQGGPDRSAGVVVIAALWANAHLSYYLGLLVLAAFWLDERARRQPRQGLARVLLAALAVSFLNPFGWRALWQPFEYFLFWRHEPIFRVIGELGPVSWGANVLNGLPLMLVSWPALVVWRAARRRVDRVEIALLLGFTLLVALGQRFLGFYAVVAAPYLSRDFSEWLGARGWSGRFPLPARAALAGAACLALGIPEWSVPDWPLGIRLRPLWYPERACDFMMEHGVRGRGFNPFDLAGYPLYRFWPERDRLPFIDIHQTGARADRDACALLYSDPRAWRTLDARHRFDYALLSRYRANPSLDALDADSSFALVFVDDVAALFVRRDGPLAQLAQGFAYRLLPAGPARVGALQATCARDSVACDRLVAELRRATTASPQNAQTRSLLANVALMHGDLDRARDQLVLALTVNPSTPRGHERLGMIELEHGQPRRALAEFEAERRRNGTLPGLELRIAQAYRRLGDDRAAAQHYRRELEHDPGDQEAADSLAALSRH